MKLTLDLTPRGGFVSRTAEIRDVEDYYFEDHYLVVEHPAGKAWIPESRIRRFDEIAD